MKGIIGRIAKAINGREPRFSASQDVVMQDTAGCASLKRRWNINDNSLSAVPNVNRPSAVTFTIATRTDSAERIMRMIISLLFILACEVLNSGSANKEHVHFKIHVPEVIKHQIHTKTVFIHAHKLTSPATPKKTKPKTQAPKTYHKESHHEDWSSWNVHEYHSDHNDQEKSNIIPEHPNDHRSNEVPTKKNRKEKMPYLHHHRNSYLPAMQHDDKPNYIKSQHGDMIGYSYPPQYAVHEDVKEVDHNNIENYMHTEGYQRGSESANGHIHSNNLTKFYEDKHEEDNHSAEEYENESREKTHAGRYFIDDSEYLRNGDKYGAEKRVSPRKFM